MTRRPLPNCWYGEACYRPDGSLGYWTSPFHIAADGTIVPDPETRTEHGTFTTDPLLFTRGTAVLAHFAGQSALGLTGNREYKEADGSGRIAGPSPVENPVLYLSDGTLIQGKTTDGADGLRYQADEGSIVTADQTHVSPDGLLANYTELHNIRIGSDQIAGLGAIVQILDRPGGTGQRYILEPGACTAIRFTFTGPNLLAVYVVKLQERQAVAFWLTADEIHHLPLYPEPEPIIGPIGASLPPGDHLYDMLGFLESAPIHQPRIGPQFPGSPTDTQYEELSSDGRTRYVKFGNPQAFETRYHDDNWEYHGGDFSGNPPMYFTDPRWFPRRMPVANPAHFNMKFVGPGMDAGSFVTGVHHAVFFDRATCREIRRDEYNRRMWLHALYPKFQWGRNLGIVPTAMRVYDPTAGIHGKDREVEVEYRAVNYGWCMWEAHRSDIVYAHGAAEFTDASRVARSNFYLVGGPIVLPELSRCEPPIVHLPPLPPPVPPGGFIVPKSFQPGGSMLQEKGGILGVGGKFARFGPIGSGLFGRRGLIWDGDAPTGDYEFTLTETSPGRGQAVDTKNLSTLGADLTQYSTDETHQFYGLKPGETPGEYETPFLYLTSDQGVKTLVFRFPQGSDRPHPYVTSLTWVTQ